MLEVRSDICQKLVCVDLIVSRVVYYERDLILTYRFKQ